MTEEALIQQLQEAKHKEKAFALLVDLYKERLYWHIRHLVKNHEDANDLLQNTFIKVYKNISSFKKQSKLYSWMYRIATNESLTFLTKKAKTLHLSYEHLQVSLVNQLATDPYFDGNEALLQLHKAVASLPERQQQVFQMKYFENLTYKNIAEILEINEGTVKANYHHATKKIEKYLAITH